MPKSQAGLAMTAHTATDHVYLGSRQPLGAGSHSRCAHTVLDEEARHAPAGKEGQWQEKRGEFRQLHRALRCLAHWCGCGGRVRAGNSGRACMPRTQLPRVCCVLARVARACVTHSVHLAVSPSQLQTVGWGSNKPVSRPISQKRLRACNPCTACAASGAPAALVHVAAGATGSYVRQLSSSLQGWQEPSGITPLQERQRRARSGQLVSPNANMGSPKGMLQLACLAACARQAQSVPPTGPSPAHMVSAQRVQVEVGLVAFTLVHSAQLAVLQLTHLPLSE